MGKATAMTWLQDGMRKATAVTWLIKDKAVAVAWFVKHRLNKAVAVTRHLRQSGKAKAIHSQSGKLSKHQQG